MDTQLRRDLAHAFTAYDRRQEKRADYNRYALPRYLMAADDIDSDVSAGVSLADSLNRRTHGPLRASVTKTLVRLGYKSLVKNNA